MKKPLVMLVLALATAVMAAQEAQQPAAQGQAQEQQKTIKDPAEYNSYVSAIQAQDPQVKISGLEGFLQQYPNSVVREDALEALMGAYQQAQNPAKTVETARRLLQANPNNLSALAVVTFIAKQSAETGQNPQQNAMEARQMAERGLQALASATKPAGISDADWGTRKKSLNAIFHSAIGFAALQTKEYDVARKHLAESVQADPNNLGEVYRLALAHLEVPAAQATPEIMSQGFWHIARAVNLAAANPAAHKSIAGYGQKKYLVYHGTEEGWNELLAQAQSSPMPPAGFVVKPDSPADRAARLLKEKPVKEMSPDEWEFILANADPATAEQVWTQIRAIGNVAFRGKVVEATPRKLTLAATFEAIEQNRGNFEVTMTGDIPANMMPKEGTEISVQGKPASFEKSPFVLRMEDGLLIAAPKPKPAPAPRRAPRRRG
jgi:tetratricopeptide (TPR) repeat protein